jgi:hypothetical protein
MRRDAERWIAIVTVWARPHALESGRLRRLEGSVFAENLSKRSQGKLELVE